jgi:hypothetical protein
MMLDLARGHHGQQLQVSQQYYKMAKEIKIET